MPLALAAHPACYLTPCRPLPALPCPIPLPADAFFAVHGGISILSRSIAEPTPCVNSTFIRAMSNFITDGLQLTDVRPASHGGAQQQQGQQAAGRKVLPPHETGGGGGRPPLRVTWALRTNRAGLQAEILKALQKRIPAETGAQVGSPHAQQAALRAAACSGLCCRVLHLCRSARAPPSSLPTLLRRCPLCSTHLPSPAQVVAVDFGTKSVEEQMRLVRGSDVLAGYHGAALTLACFMHRQSALVEVEEEWRWVGGGEGWGLHLLDPCQPCQGSTLAACASRRARPPLSSPAARRPAEQVRLLHQLRALERPGVQTDSHCGLWQRGGARGGQGGGGGGGGAGRGAATNRRRRGRHVTRSPVSLL